MKRLLALAAAVWLTGCLTSPASTGVGGAADASGGCRDVDAAVPGTPVATFDNDTEQFVFDVAGYGARAGVDAGAALTNLADPDAGIAPPPSLSYDGTDGNPSPGSLQIVAPFSGANQALVAYHFFGCGAIHDWSGKVLHARIKILDGTFTGEALLYVSTSTTCATYDFGYGAFAALSPTSCWQELRLPLGGPSLRSAGYDASSVVDFGIQFYTLSSAKPVTFLVDSFSIE